MKTMIYSRRPRSGFSELVTEGVEGMAKSSHISSSYIDRKYYRNVVRTFINYRENGCLIDPKYGSIYKRP